MKADLKQGVSSIEGLGLTPDDIEVCFPPDLLTEGRGTGINVMVDLYRLTGRTPEMVQAMADQCTLVIRRYFSTAIIGCYPRFLEPELASVQKGVIVPVDDTPPCPVCGAGTKKNHDGTERECVNCHDIGTTCLN